MPSLKALLCYAAELAFHMKHLENLAYDPRQNEKKILNIPKSCSAGESGPAHFCTRRNEGFLTHVNLCSRVHMCTLQNTDLF